MQPCGAVGLKLAPESWSSLTHAGSRLSLNGLPLTSPAVGLEQRQEGAGDVQQSVVVHIHGVTNIVVETQPWVLLESSSHVHTQKY